MVDRVCAGVLSWVVVALSPPARASEGALALRYEEAWYQENGLEDLKQAIALYRSIADAKAAEPALAVKALLRLAFCYRQLGDERAAAEEELEAHRRFPDEIKKFPTHRLEVLHKQLNEAFNVGDSEAAGQAVVRFLKGLDAATVHSICESCYAQAQRERATDPLGSIPMLRKAIAISMYLRQLERSAFAHKEIGDIYANAGRTDEAIAAYRKTQQDFPESKNAGAWAQLRIAEVHHLQGHLADAVEAYRVVVRTYPGQTLQGLWACLWMGEAFRAAGKLADARSAWRHALEDFNEPAYAGQIAIAARLLGQAARDEVVRLPDDESANDVAYFLAVQAEMAGQTAHARRYYQRCLALSRGNDWPRPLAAQALQRLGGAPKS